MQKCAMTFFSSLLSGWILLGFTSGNATAQPPHPNQPKANVILIIGDGMDDVQISIARNYLKGARGRLTLDALPVRSTVQVLTVDEAGYKRLVDNLEHGAWIDNSTQMVSIML